MCQNSYSLTDVFDLSHTALFALPRENATIFDRHLDGSPERKVAQANLRLIRRVLEGPQHRPG
jgi:hypothetical protein